MKTKHLMLMSCFLIGLVAAGCGKSESKDEANYLTPDDIENVYYLSEEELPNDMAYIVRTEKDKTKDSEEVTRYYPIYSGIETNCEKAEIAAGEDPSRIAWVNYNVDEGYIPTMYPGDKLIYKSSTYIPTKYSLEKFFDDGYTLGVAGLKQDLSGNYRFDADEFGSVTMTTSDAVGFSALTDIESIYLVSVGENRVTPLNVSNSGSITGLTLMDQYACDIRQGTERINATLTCNIHLFSSAETYGFGSFSFITPHIAQLNVPDYVTTGYYDLNGLGFFRYVKEEGVDYHDLSQEDYNETIFVYNEDGGIVGTTLGLSFDENGFLVANGYEEGNESVSSTITHKTSLISDKNGYFSGQYTVTAVGDPNVSGNNYIYTVNAINNENNEQLVFQYTRKPGDPEIVAGITYAMMFTRPQDSFDGYVLSYFSAADGLNAATENETGTESDAGDETDTEVSTDEASTEE